jgi:hypothetical protein
MNASVRLEFGSRLVARPHILLAVHLLLLHVLAFGGWQILAVRLLWLVALGLFLIWQPFIAGERPISSGQGGVLFAIALGSAVLLNPWLLLVWCGALAAVIGGRVLWTGARRERMGYLLAFGYLIALTVLGVVPEISPAVVLDPLPRPLFARYLPLLLPILLLFPGQSAQRRPGDTFDLFYGLLVFLVLAVFVLGALAYMLVGGLSYVESLFKTSLGMAGALLVVAWAWNPRAGFSGMGSAFSRYLLSFGMPLEHWLEQLSAESERELQPERFLAAAMHRLRGMPWVRGARWLGGGRSDMFGSETPYQHGYQADGVELLVFFRYSPSPAMRWYVEWLLRLAAEFYLVKRQTHELQRMGYLQAVYETGARVTHDVKNLLQSMQTLCYAASQPGDPAGVAALLGRQLPQITERLKSTLEKLQSPQAESAQWDEAERWWQDLQERYAAAGIVWRGQVMPGLQLPRNLYDSVAENLLQNALAKRQRHPGLEITVDLAGSELRVADDGMAIPASLAEVLLYEPVVSEDGLGIGLYHAARQAQGLGYRLVLVENRDGRVVFSLAAAS